MARAIRSKRGGSAVEFAIVLPVLLLFVLGLIDTGRLMWSNATLARAVEAASRCAAIGTAACGSHATTASYAATQSWALGPGTLFNVIDAPCGTQVVGTMTFVFVIPWFYVAAPFGVGNSITLTATACFPSA